MALPSAVAGIDLIGSLKLEGGAEITAFSPAAKLAFVVSGGTSLRVVDLANPFQPKELTALAQTLTASAQSVAVANGLVAVALSHPTDKAQDGSVVFFRLAGTGASATLTSLGALKVGALPDSLAFNGDGSRLVVVNEGESIDSTTTNGKGSISIIDTSAFATATQASQFTVMSLDFSTYDGREEELRSRGIRLAGKDIVNGQPTAVPASKDFEPEAVSIAGNTAYITLQENNAIAVVDLTTAKVTNLFSAGLQDWSRGIASAKNIGFSFDNPATQANENVLGTAAGKSIFAGGLSGLSYAGEINGRKQFYAVSDRGPNTDPAAGVSGVGFPLPVFQPSIYKLELDEASGKVTVLETIGLKRADGTTKLTGLTEQASDGTSIGPDGNGVLNQTLSFDPYGIDSESVLTLTLGNETVFAVSDEYRPMIALFKADGTLIKRFVPQGSKPAGSGSDTLETLPAVYAQRAGNRGFEGMAFNSKDGLLYAFIQSPISVNGSSSKSQLLRILAVDPANGEAKAEYLYNLAGPSAQDKIGDVAFDASRNVFYVIERDSAATAEAHKSVFEVSLVGATNVLGKDWNAALGVAQPELLDNTQTPSVADKLLTAGVKLVVKNELFNLGSIGAGVSAPTATTGAATYDKAEGLALLPDGRMVVAWDNDFGLDGTDTGNVLSVISFTPQPIDTDDTGSTVANAVRNLYGQVMPDGIATFTVGGKTYIAVAGEGDNRNGDNANDIAVDDQARASASNFPGLSNSNLGTHLNLDKTQGDYNGDGTYEQAFTFGSRSLRIFDSVGNVVFDSGNQLDLAAQKLGIYSDGRSDDKGVEPEMVSIGIVDGRVLAFVGLERTTKSAVAVFDVTTPGQSQLLRIATNPADISPEGLQFVSRNSAEQTDLLLVSNELVSGGIGSLNIYGLTGKVLNSPEDEKTMLKPVAGSGLVTDALFTIGESSRYNIAGIPDGQGAFRLDSNRIRILVNAEIGSTQGSEYVLANGTVLKGARVSFLDINNAGQVIDGGIAYQTVYDRAGQVVINASQLGGGIQRFCSANLIEANTFGTGKGAADRVYLLGEETAEGTAFALDVAKGELWALPDFGRGSWESATMVDTGSTETVAYFLGDDYAPGPLYLYVGTKNANGNFLQRNGLSGGQLYVWKSSNGVTNHDKLAEGANSTGAWVAINAKDGNGNYKTAAALRQEAIDAGAFVGYRVEDVDYNPNKPTELAFTTTGGGTHAAAGSGDKFGSVWTLALSFTNGQPTSATLKHLYDGDVVGKQQAGLRSPDNLAWSADGNIYVQEDKSTAFEGQEASIFKVNATTGAAERILQVDRTAVPAGMTDSKAAELGAWETSGIIDVSGLYSTKPGTDFFANVQAHGVGGGTITSQNLVEGGQIVAIGRQPDTTAPTLIKPVDASQPVAGALKVQSLITIGEKVGAFMPTGTPDGMGAYNLNSTTIRLFVQSEIGKTVGYAYQLANGTELTGARINYLDIDKATNAVIGGGLAYNRVIDRVGREVTSAAQIGGSATSTAGFDRFCSANLVEANLFGAGKGFVDRIHILGEEVFTEPGGSMVALDVATQTLYTLPDLGYGTWESATPIDTGNTSQIALLLGDDYAGVPLSGSTSSLGAPIYLYVGTKSTAPGAGFLERNGLTGGKLYVWRADTGAALNRPSEFKGFGNQANGSWLEVSVRDASKAGSSGYDSLGYKHSGTLRAEVDAAGAFMGARIEDLHTNPLKGNQVAFVATGNENFDGGADLLGTVYTLDIGFKDGKPSDSLLRIVYDGDDAGNGRNGLRSPDNLTWSADGFLYIQEDKAVYSATSDAFGPEKGSIWKVDPNSGQATRWAQIDDTVDPDGAGGQVLDTNDSGYKAYGWESSGIIDVSALYGNAPGTDFFANVQAHGVKGGALSDYNLGGGGQVVKFTNKLAVNGNETVVGTAAADVLEVGHTSGLTGSGDTVFAGLGNDTVDLGLNSYATRNQVFLGAGNDAVYASYQDRLFGDSGNDEFVSEGAGLNRISGGEGDDKFFISAKSDRLIGGTGADQFYLRASAQDVLISGGQGADVIYLAIGQEFSQGGHVITDFELGVDRISLGQFTRKDVQFQQVGADTLLTRSGVELVTFRNILSSELNQDRNFFAV